MTRNCLKMRFTIVTIFLSGTDVICPNALVMNGVIKGPESWLIAKSITPQLIAIQSKINPKLLLVVLD